MKETFDEMCKAMDTAIAQCMKHVDLATIATMDPDELVAMQSALAMVMACKNFTKKFIEDQEEKDRKLNEILRYVKK